MSDQLRISLLLRIIAVLELVAAIKYVDSEIWTCFFCFATALAWWASDKLHWGEEPQPISGRR